MVRGCQDPGPLPRSHTEEEIEGSGGDGCRRTELRERMVGATGLRGQQGEVVGCSLHAATLQETTPQQTGRGKCNVYVGGRSLYSRIPHSPYARIFQRAAATAL